MKSAMLAAEATFDALKDGATSGDVSSYQAAVESSWIWEELRSVRNYQPSFQYGMVRAHCRLQKPTTIMMGVRLVCGDAVGWHGIQRLVRLCSQGSRAMDAPQPKEGQREGWLSLLCPCTHRCSSGQLE